MAPDLWSWARRAHVRNRSFDPDAVRAVKGEADADLAAAGLELAAEALRTGLVDEIQVIANPVVVGGSKRFPPVGVRLDLAFLEKRRFGRPSATPSATDCAHLPPALGVHSAALGADV